MNQHADSANTPRPASGGALIDVVKRSPGNRAKPATERFNYDKLHASIKAACLSVRSPEGHADQAAHGVCKIVLVWLSDKSEVTSQDLRSRASDVLMTFHPEAAHIYKHYHKII